MSILIKGMKMPKDCWDCKLDLAVAEQGAYCPFIERVITKDKCDMFSGIHPDCPLVEVPEPHGRLIDADALNLDYEVNMADDWKTAHEIANCVRYAPTVIEAEEQEDGV